MYVDFNILNQLGSPAFNSNTLANRPAPGYVGRLFVSIDTFALYRDNGTGWDLIGASGGGSVLGTGVSTRVAFWDTTNSISSNANLYWDNTNNRLGIGTDTPNYILDIQELPELIVNFNSGAGKSLLQFSNLGTAKYSVGYVYDVTLPHFQIYDELGAKNVFGVLQSNRFVGINYQFTGASDIPRYTFDVFGNAGITGDTHLGYDVINLQAHFLSTGKRFYTEIGGLTNGIDIDFNTRLVTLGNVFNYFQLDLNTDQIYAFTNNFLINTTTSVGTKFQVNGDTYIKGNGTSNATFGLKVVNGASLTSLIVDDSRNVGIGESSPLARLHIRAATTTVNPTAIRIRNSGDTYDMFSLSGGGFLKLNDLTTPLANNTICSLFQIDSTTKGILIPRLTTTQINAITNLTTGVIVYNTTLETICFYTTAGWQKVNSSNM